MVSVPHGEKRICEEGGRRGKKGENKGKGDGQTLNGHGVRTVDACRECASTPSSLLYFDGITSLQNRGSMSTATTPDLGGQFLCMHGCPGYCRHRQRGVSRVARNHNSILGGQGLPMISAYPARASFKFGDGHPGKVRRAAEITAGTSGSRRALTAFALEADSPALLRKEESETLCGRSDFAREAFDSSKSRGGNSPEGESNGALCPQRSHLW